MAGLNARFVASIRGEPGRRGEHADNTVAGLALRVTEQGGKSWTLRYRTLAGEQRRLTLGRYPAINLKDARERALKALHGVSGGQDLAQEKLASRRRARLGRTEKPQTLDALWQIYVRDVMPTKSPRTVATQTWLWAKHVQPRLGANTLASLDRGTARAACKAIGAKAQ